MMTMSVSKRLQSLHQALFLLLLVLHGVTAVRRLPHDAVLFHNATTTTTTTRRRLSPQVATSASDHLVTNLTFLQEGDFTTPHYAGLLPANPDGTKYLFYWLFHPPSSDEHTPLVIWLNGGPGCSSMDGLFLEHGPFRLDFLEEQWKIKIHPQSWHLAPAYVVYVDQPVGTGLSYTTSNQYPTNDVQVNQDFTYFLQEFLQLHSATFLLEENNSLKRPIFFAGESHAGHYIPSMMHYLHTHTPNDNFPIPIRIAGAAIGNGWVDPYHQYAGAQAAYGHGLVDLAQKQALDQAEGICQAKLQQKSYRSNECFALLDDIIAQSEGKTGTHKVSQYDARKWELKRAPRTFPPGHERVEAYLGGWPTPAGDASMDIYKQVLEEIHATASQQAGQRYQECTDPPYNALAHQDGLGVVDDVVALLEDGTTRLLFFNGIQDLICNHVGTEVMLQNLPWKHKDDWTESKRYSWTSGQATSVSGYVKEYGNLQYLKVMDSGHMVPMDVPEVALDMMRIFLYGGSFAKSEQQLDRSKDQATCPVCPTCDDVSPAGNNDNVPSSDEENNPVFGYVVAHSWIGAVVAVSVFLVVLVFVRRRQMQQPPVVSSYGNLEMKEQQYRDEPENGEGYQEDDDEEEAVANGNGII